MTVAPPKNVVKTDKIFCTTRETAKMLGVSIGTVQLWVDTGLLSAWKTEGGHRRVTRESINKLLHLKSGLPSAPALNSRFKVLAVEDSSNLRRLYEVVLAQWPMAPEVTIVDNGIKAIMLMERQIPDLLILDLNMPGVDGFQLVKILQREERYANLTIVVVSGLDEIEVAAQGGVPPGVFVLRKPVPFAKLLAIATTVVDKTHAAAGQAPA